MGILDSLAARLGYTKALAAQTAPPEMLSPAQGLHWDVPEAAQAERQMRLYAMLSWISTAIDRTAEIAAEGKYSVTQISGEPGGADDEQIVNHPFEKLLHRPNPSQSAGEFLRDAFTMFRITGNLYLFSNTPSEGAPPDELWIVPSHFIRPIPDGRSYIAGYEYTPPGYQRQIIEPWKIVHLKTSNPMNPFVGLSAIQSLALDAYADLAAQKWSLKFYDKDNARLPSILAFKSMVAEPVWKEIQTKRETEWGGTNQPGVMLLRGVGDNLQLLQATANQKDMQLLDARNFTKEEIYGKLAPGLASILAVNATEANASVGKATLIEFGVWPTLMQLGQKFSAAILPLYGDNLRGEFDDMRQTNRILDLQEEQEYAKYHTVNEIRAEYYDEGPLELDPELIKQMEEKPAGKLDPRGFLFAAQIGPSTPAPGEKKQPPPQFGQGQQPPAQVEQGDGNSPDQAAQQQGDGNVPDLTADQMAELKAWERWAVKRAEKPREFESRSLPLFVAADIKAKLNAARNSAQVRAAFERYKPAPVEDARTAPTDTLDALLAEVKAARAELARTGAQ